MKPMRSSSWSAINGVIEDTTRSGKRKRRLLHSQDPIKYSVKFHFTHSQYDEFCTWWKNTCLYGLNSFLFKKIDAVSGDDTEYRIVAGSAPSFSNPSGDIIECTMDWEEV